ncbi:MULTISPECIES: hypothetical protein [unclassified Ensifer]|uniref:hypothetical protein n=1 Tax=unclassified Ensifer TaxID=2633371 RepID=UPI0011121AD7|nr:MULTISPECIES: hypothetical protein [unclassified Ensifer]
MGEAGLELSWFQLACTLVFNAGLLVGFATMLRVQIHFGVWTDVNQPSALQVDGGTHGRFGMGRNSEESVG